MNQNNTGVTMAIGNSPLDYDMALVSVNTQGTLGSLNTQVLNAYNYSKIKELSSVSLSKGYHLLEHKGLKPILFVVTVGQNNTKNSLTNNLINALENSTSVLEGKRVWVPLMGTGAGGLSFKESYEITVNILRKFSFNTNFVISFPENKEGIAFYNSLREQNYNDIFGSTIDDGLTTKGSFFDKEPTKPVTKQTTNKKLPTEPPKQKKPERLEPVLKELLQRNYYLAEFNDLKEQNINNYLFSGLWENKIHDKAIERIVNTVKIGDVLLLLYGTEEENAKVLQIYGVGVVKENVKNGKTLKIVWHKFDARYLIDSVIEFEHFTRILPKDIKNILKKYLKIIPNFQKKLKQVDAATYQAPENKLKAEQPKKIPNITTIAGLVSDVDSGEDYLEIDQDVNAFARVISAKSFIPPLAIALLGKWGSGKSFFMRKLKERIQSYSNNTEQEVYCTGIAHVHFNAWSYVDSNLWAGIITKIFEGLQEYISNQSKAEAQKKEIEKILLEQLSSSKQHFQELEQRKTDINKKIQRLKDKKIASENLLEAKIEDIKKKSIKNLFKQIDYKFNVKQKVQEALQANDSFNQSTKEFSKIIPEKYWQSPEELYTKSKTALTFTKTFFGKSVWKNNLLWLAVILIIVIGVPIFMLFTEYKISEIDFEKIFRYKYWVTISLIGTALLRAYKTARHLHPLIASFWKLKEAYVLEKENALFKFKQEEKAITLQIENYKQNIQQLNIKIGEAEAQKKDIEYRLDNTHTTEALFKFIENRSTSDDYKKHLGIVSVIRKDFEILSDLFTDHNTELNEVKAKETYQTFRSKFERPLERIILYIDDLDRCTDDRVIQVLEAVNLLMAYPLFVVVVGVDPRWVKNALIKKHELQFGGHGERAKLIERIEPSGYLEKIFQIPFHLQEATDENVKYMLKTLAESNPSLKIATKEGQEKNGGDVKESNSETLANTGDVLKEVKVEHSSNKEVNIDDVRPLETNEEVIASLKFVTKEIKLIQEFSKILGANPRTLKRFVNIFRIIKAHKGFNYSEEAKDEELLAIIFLIALPIGKYKCLVKPFEAFINRETDSKIDGKTLQDFLNETLDNNDEKEAQNKIQNIFNTNANQLLKTDKKVFKKYSKFIKRFTFNGV